MTALERIECGFFTKENSVTVEQLENSENPYELIIKSEDVLPFESVVLTAKQGEKLLNGVYEQFDLANGRYKVYCENEFWGVGNCENGKLVIRPYVRG